MVADGFARMLVASVGTNPTWGKMMIKISHNSSEETPLQTRLSKLASAIGKVGLAAAFLVLSVLLFRYFTGKTKNVSGKTEFNGSKTKVDDVINAMVRMITAAITIIVVAIPEGLPLAVTLTLAYSMKRMMADQAMVQKLSACKTMGSATTICTDKTGTLTLNQMTVTKFWLGVKVRPSKGQHLDVTHICALWRAKDMPKKLLVQGAATLEQRVYDLEQTHGPTHGQDFEDVVTELRLEIEDLSGRVGVLTRAFGNASSGGMEFTRARVPEPRAYGGARNAKELDNFLFDREQYFKAVKADAEETRISMATMYLSGDAKLWWQTKHDEMQRGLSTIETWEQLKHELKLQFFPKNVEYNARRALRDLKHTGTIREYVKEFSGLMLDIKDMSEKDKLFFFLEGLKPWARVELQRQRVQDLAHAQAAAECLTDYAEPKQRDSGSPRKSRGGGKSQGHGKPKSGGANTSTSKTHSGGGQWQQKSYGDKAKAPQQFSTSKTKGPISCFLCNGPHRLSECPQKRALNALATVSDHVSQPSDDDSEEEEVRSKRSGKGSKAAGSRVGAFYMMNAMEKKVSTWRPKKNAKSGKVGKHSDPKQLLNKGCVTLGQDCIEGRGSSTSIAANVLELLCQGITLNTTGSVYKSTSGSKFEFSGSPTEKAILSWGFLELNMDMAVSKDNCMVLHVEAFNSEKKQSRVLMKRKFDNTVHVRWKGAAEMALAMCSHYSERMRFDQTIHGMAANSLRYISFAHKKISEAEHAAGQDDQKLSETCLALLGMVGLKDPCRPGVKKAVEDCQLAGLSVKMITGDNIFIARAIATECGILRPNQDIGNEAVIEGVKFQNYTPEERMERVEKICVMARSSPLDKLLMVQCLKQKGHVVAVTGNGTNDAPALKEPDIGLSMGIQGTEVVKESSDIVILDDNFASVTTVLCWGRCVYNNIQKFIQFQLTVNVAALVINFVAVVSAGEVPLTAVQLLWVNLIMDTLGALALATPTKELMTKPPVGRTEPLITNIMWRNLLAQALYQIAALLTLQFRGKSILGVNQSVNNTLIFNTFVLCQVFNEFNA
ncbi:unnamed protein product [Camellia sinensis]